MLTSILAIILLILTSILRGETPELKFKRRWGRVFLVWWGGLIFISGTDPFGLYSVSVDVYLLVFLFVFSYFLGFIAISQPSQKSFGETFIGVFYEYEKLAQNKWFNFFICLCMVVLFYYVKKYYGYISINGNENARTARFESGVIFGSSIEAVVYDYFISATMWFLKFLVAFGVVFGRTRKFIWFLSVGCCLLYLMFGAGRNIILEIIIFTILLLWVKSATLGSKDVNKRRGGLLSSILSLGFFYFFAVYATYFRMQDEGGGYTLADANLAILEHLIIYCVGSFRALDYAYNNLQGVLGGGYGIFTFSGFDDIVSLTLRFLGFDFIPYSNYWGTLLAEPINIGSVQQFNSLYTAIFNFYFDFGVLGVFLGGLGFGMVCAVSLKSFLLRNNLISLFILALMFCFSILSCLTWKLSSGPVVVVVVLSVWINTRSKRFISKG